MPLNGIDISSHNEGIDLDKLKLDFVIVKATQGKTYKNPYYSKWIKQAKRRGLLVGAYHYISGIGAKAEAAAFYNAIKGDLGSVMVCIDWEKYQNRAYGNLDYLREFIRELKVLIPERRFMLYASLSQIPKSVAKEFGMGLWVAQYANNNRVNGFQKKPWNEGAYACEIRQYTEYGYLEGWAGRLDLNKAYMTRDGWAEWCGYTAPKPAKPATGTSVDEVFPKSLKGRWKVVAPSGVNIRRKPSTEGTIAGSLDKGDTVYLDSTRTLAGGYVWGTYIGNSGKRCYVAVGTQKGTVYMKPA